MLASVKWAFHASAGPFYGGEHGKKCAKAIRLKDGGLKPKRGQLNSEIDLYEKRTHCLRNFSSQNYTKKTSQKADRPTSPLQINYSSSASKSAIDDHIARRKIWYSQVTFSDLIQPKRTGQIYIELDIYVNPQSNRSSPDIETETITLKEMFRRFDNHYILLGHPGAGKTTSSKQLCRLALDHNEQLSKDFNFPLVVLLRVWPIKNP